MQWHEFRSHIRHLPAREMGRLERAFNLGKKVHGSQKRLSGDPYFNHPIAAAMMLSDLGADADTLIASLLHDTVEDTPLSVPEISKQFGGKVAEIIEGMTKLNSEDVAMNPNLNEQIETLRKIFTLMQADIRIMVIKLIDRLHNMQTIEFLPPDRQKALAQETLEFFVKIADKLCMRDTRDELEALSLSILEPDIYKKLKELRATEEQRGFEVIESVKRGFSAQNPWLGRETKIDYAHKSWNQLRQQLEYASGSPAGGLSFVTAVFVCRDADSCYRTLGILHQNWKREILSFEDFISVPQLNGYRGIHTTVIWPDGTRIRCKIRTIEMQEYARLGVSSVCFKGPTNIGEILPWTKLITPLSSDTEGSSSDFWQNLKSDILGRAITVHGPDDTTIQLPNNATALDGVFHLFKENALRTKAIRVNGQEVPMNTVLTRGISLELEMADAETCSLEWLNYVNTGFTVAKIRNALAAHPDHEKILAGQLILQKLLSVQKKGMLEEFNVKSLSKLLHLHGYGSSRETYIAIAEGRQKAQDVYEALFNPHSTNNQEQRSKYKARFSLPQIEITNLLKLLFNLGPHFEIDWPSIRMHMHNNLVRINGGIGAIGRDIKLFEKDLQTAGATDIEIEKPAKLEFLITTVLIVLWALNPVIAKYFLGNGVTPVTLISIRMLVFGLCASFLFIGWRATVGRRFTGIPNVLWLSVFPSVATVVLSIFTYNALLSVPPSLHLIILRFTVLLLPAIHFINKTKKWIVPLMIAALALPGFFFLLTSSLRNDIGSGIIFSVLALFTYVIYSVMVERTLHDYKIGFRYPAILFASGLLLGLFGIVLLPFINLENISKLLLASIALYAFFCVFIPHVLFYMFLNNRQMKNASDLFFLEPPIAVIAEISLLGIFLPAWLYVLFVLVLTGLYFYRGQGKAVA